MLISKTYDPNIIIKVINDLKVDFENILENYHKIVAKHDGIETKINNFKTTYNDLVKQNGNKVFLFCLDSLFFQYKLLNLEFENYHKTLAIIQNRIYGDYYKLYQIICSQCSENQIIISEPSQEFPIYKDIDPFFKYKISDIVAIHNHILDILYEINRLYIAKLENIQQKRNEIQVGFALMMFVNTLEYERDLCKGQIMLYLNYMYFYHVSQGKYLDKIHHKLVSFEKNLDKNVLLHSGEFDTAEICIEDAYGIEDIIPGPDGIIRSGSICSLRQRNDMIESSMREPEISTNIEKTVEIHPEMAEEVRSNLSDKEHPTIVLKELASLTTDDDYSDIISPDT